MIEVRIDADQLQRRFENEVHRSMHVLKRLRDEGIPATGVLSLVCVERGVLEISLDDLAFTEYVYRWRE